MKRYCYYNAIYRRDDNAANGLIEFYANNDEEAETLLQLLVADPSHWIKQ